MYPELHNGVITIIRPDQEFIGPPFLRGDSNHDGAVSIADSIYLLGYLFNSGARPYCPDEADVNDDGALNIGDAIGILSYLFGGTSPPAFPFPSYGLDPTDDSLPGCGEE